jgi:hypothetical protein
MDIKKLILGGCRHCHGDLYFEGHYVCLQCGHEAARLSVARRTPAIALRQHAGNAAGKEAA